VRFEAMQIN
jgi:hypothetical protein